MFYGAHFLPPCFRLWWEGWCRLQITPRLRFRPATSNVLPRQGDHVGEGAPDRERCIYSSYILVSKSTGIILRLMKKDERWFDFRHIHKFPRKSSDATSAMHSWVLVLIFSLSSAYAKLYKSNKTSDHYSSSCLEPLLEDRIKKEEHPSRAVKWGSALWGLAF